MLPYCLGPVGTRRTPEILPKDIRCVCTPERHDELVRAFQRQRRPNLLDAANDNPVNAAVPASSTAVNLRSYALPFVHALQAKSHNGANEETQLGSPSAELPPVLQESDSQDLFDPRRREWSFCSHSLAAELSIVHYSLLITHDSL
jgi:hypothetical protein